MRLLTSVIATLICGTATVYAAPPAIVADTPVTGSLVQQVLGDLGEVRVLLPAGASAHHYQMRPSDAQALQGAGLLVWTGPELTPWLDRAADSLGGDTSQLRLLQVKGTRLRNYGGDAGHHDHDGHAHEHEGHDHDHSHAHDHDHADGHDHDHSGTDPHAWLNPDNGALWLDAIASRLAEADPDNAQTYRDNATTAATALAAVDAKIAAGLTSHADKSIVVFHDAYGYFTDHYRLKPAIPLSAGDASTPSAARVAALRDQIAESGAVCVFPEYGHDPKLILSATESTGTRTGEPLDPEGSGTEQGPDLYTTVLTGLAATITTCLTAS